MSRRPPPRDYYEDEAYDSESESESEHERDWHPRSRRRRHEFEDDVEYRHRRPLPPVEDLARLHVGERPAGDLVRESLMRPRERGPIVRRRGREEVDEFSPERTVAAEREREEEYVRPSVPRRKHRPRDIDEEELVIDERERRGGRRRRAERELEEDDMVIRRAPPLDYDSDERVRPREKKFEDEEDEFDLRSAGSRRRRRPRRVETEEVIIDDREQDRDRGRRHRGERKFEDDDVAIRWKHRAPPPPDYDDVKLEMRESRRRRRRDPSESEYERELSDHWPKDRDDERANDKTRVRWRFPSRPRHWEDEEDEDVVIRKRDRGRDQPRSSSDSDEILVRKKKGKSPLRERSPSVEPLRVPQMHKDMAASHIHIDHAYARPPRAPSPESWSSRSDFDEVDLRHRDKRAGRISEEDIAFQRRDEGDSISPRRRPPSDFRNPWERVETSPPRRRPRALRRENESLIVEPPRSRGGREAPGVLGMDKVGFHKSSARNRSSINGTPDDTTDDWSMVHAPRSESSDVTGALNIVDVAPRGASGDQLERSGRIGRQVVEDRRDNLWTEITKDLVVREAIEQLGYEYEETRMFYYIFSYLERSEIDELVELSDEVRRARRRRIREIHRERASLPPPPAPLADRVPRPRMLEEKRARDRELAVDFRQR